MNSYQEHVLNKHVQLRKLQAQRPDPDEWPTKDELAAYEEALAKVREEVEDVDQRHAELGEVAKSILAVLQPS